MALSILVQEVARSALPSPFGSPGMAAVKIFLQNVQKGRPLWRKTLAAVAGLLPTTQSRVRQKGSLAKHGKVNPGIIL